jgi:hypothetical protein
MLLYEEALQRDTLADSRTRVRLRDELNRAFKMITALVPTNDQPIDVAKSKSEHKAAGEVNLTAE